MSFTVRFLNYAGDDLLGVVTAEKGEDITGKAPTPETIDGKAFVSWNAPITNIQEDMTVRPLYATLYQVTFYGFDGETILKTEAVAEGGIPLKSGAVIFPMSKQTYQSIRFIKQRPLRSAF